MISWQPYIDDIQLTFRKHKELAERALGQLASDEDFFRKPAADSNSIALVIKHVAGNLASRWTDFPTTDGEKPGRDRDAEFVINSQDTPANLLLAWEQAWNTLFRSLASLVEEDAPKKVTIRGEEHTILQAIHRSLAHTAYHVGQITYLARMFNKSGGQWITIPPGQSKTWRKPASPWSAGA